MWHSQQTTQSRNFLFFFGEVNLFKSIRQRTKKLTLFAILWPFRSTILSLSSPYIMYSTLSLLKIWFFFLVTLLLLSPLPVLTQQQTDLLTLKTHKKKELLNLPIYLFQCFHYFLRIFFFFEIWLRFSPYPFADRSVIGWRMKIKDIKSHEFCFLLKSFRLIL
jgi:hypothetical protein